MRIRIRIFGEVKIQMLYRYRLKMEPWRAVNAYNGGVEAQNGAVEGLKTSGHGNTLMRSRIRITIHIKKKSLIRIHNPDFRYLDTVHNEIYLKETK
jgi:hypothetical protein